MSLCIILNHVPVFPLSPPLEVPCPYVPSIRAVITDTKENSNDVLGEINVLTLYVRAGCDNRKYGACPFCQIIFMLLMLKLAQGGKPHMN